MRFSRLLALWIAFAVAGVASAQEPVSFKKDIAPILLNNCLACHGPKKAEGSYRIDTFERSMAAGDSGVEGFKAKELEGSEAFRRIIDTNPKERMPLDGDPLPAEQVALLKRWLEEGANYDGGDPKAALTSIIPPPTHPPAPATYPATQPITAVAFSPDGAQLFVAGYHEVTVWNPADGQLIRRIGNVGQRTYGIAFSPDGKSLAVACGTPGRLGEVRIFNPSGELQRVVATTSDVVFDAAFSPDGTKLATAAADGAVRVFEVATGKELNSITSHSDWVFAVAWSPDGTKLASGSRDKTAKAYDMAKNGELMITFSGHNAAVRGVFFHPEGKHVYSSGSDNKLRRWALADAKQAGELPLGGEAYKLASGGEFLVTASADQKVRQVKAKEQQQVREYAGAKDWVLCSSIHDGTKRIAAGAFDGSVLVWNAEDGKLVTQFIAAPGYTPPAK